MFSYSKPKDFESRFKSDIDTIRGYLCDIGNTYLLIAFRVYEIDFNKSYLSSGYKNIVEACEKELGFKKSTTYNLLNVVKTYGVDDKGKISYQQLTTYTKYSYSQLVEMLSLGSEQRAEITPATPVSAIRMLKKSNEKDKPETFQTSGKISKPPERSETFQTSGKSSGEDDHVYEIKTFYEDDKLFSEFDPEFVKLVDEFTDLMCDFLFDFGGVSSPHHYFGEGEFEKYSPDDLEERFKVIMALYRQSYNNFYKRLDLEKKSAV